MKLLEVNNLKKYFPIRKGFFRRHIGDFKAVDGVSYHIDQAEILGLVGESGSGKSTVAKSSIRLIEPTDGKILFSGNAIETASRQELKKIRRQAQIVFQDPLSSLNPRKTILENMGESLFVHQLVSSKKEQIDCVVDTLEKVGLSASILHHYPHQFSGGQQQRISIGRALILNPKLLICDEITSALDLSVQAQILNLLSVLQKQLGLSYLLISHDLSVIRHLCDRVIVMHHGKIVEEAKTEILFETPQHPYTQQLLNSVLNQ